MTDKLTCKDLIGDAQTLADQLEVTSDFPEEEFHPYYPIFAATFRHECTNYDDLLRRMLTSHPIELLEATRPFGPDGVPCTCDYDRCLNADEAHDILKDAAGELGRPVYERIHRST